MNYQPKSGEHIFETARAVVYLARCRKKVIVIETQGLKVFVDPVDSAVDVVVKYDAALKARWKSWRDVAEKDAADQIAKAEEKYGNPPRSS